MDPPALVRSARSRCRRSIAKLTHTHTHRTRTETHTHTLLTPPFPQVLEDFESNLEMQAMDSIPKDAHPAQEAHSIQSKNDADPAGRVQEVPVYVGQSPEPDVKRGAQYVESRGACATSPVRSGACARPSRMALCRWPADSAYCGGHQAAAFKHGQRPHSCADPRTHTGVRAARESGRSSARHQCR